MRQLEAWEVMQYDTEGSVPQSLYIGSYETAYLVFSVAIQVKALNFLVSLNPFDYDS